VERLAVRTHCLAFTGLRCRRADSEKRSSKQQE
jgi:hypothetical protein